MNRASSLIVAAVLVLSLTLTLIARDARGAPDARAPAWMVLAAGRGG